MNKLKLCIIFGGMSTEHEVSVKSGISVIQNLNKNKYDIFAVFIDKSGKWYHLDNKFLSNLNSIENQKLSENKKNQDYIEIQNSIEFQKNLKLIDNEIIFIKQCDVVFPVLHGEYGEDGSIQGMLKMLKIPYVGCDILSSAIAMDKVYAKIIFNKAKIKNSEYVYLKKSENHFILVDNEFNEITDSLKNICNLIEQKISYPMFVKPSNSGSSVGINKAKNQEELIKAIEYASMFDKKILIEESVIGKEIECSVLGKEDVKASCLGEITPAEDFYSYDAKYNNSESKLTIPANISPELTKKVQEIAVKAYKAIDAQGFARVDFFVNDKTNEIYINEINTIPGFTEISMYPKLWEHDGIKYSELLDKLIELACF